MTIRILKNTLAKATKTATTVEIVLNPSPSVGPDSADSSAHDVVHRGKPMKLPVRPNRRT